MLHWLFIIFEIAVSFYMILLLGRVIRNLYVAIETRKDSKISLKYDNWEFPHYDITNQDDDEITVDISILVLTILWFINLTPLTTKFTMGIFVFLALTALFFVVPSAISRATERLQKFYEDMRKIEDYSTISPNYVIYRARLEALVDNIRSLVFIAASSFVLFVNFIL